MSLNLTPPAPARGQDCPPAWALEASVADADEARAISAHVQSCASCLHYVETLIEQRRRFLAARPPERFVAQLEQRAAHAGREPGRLRFVGAGAGAMALLACVLFAARPARERSGVDFKGALVAIHVQRAGQEHIAGAGEVLHPRDALRFVIRSERAGYAAVFERDARGTVAVVAPFGAKVPAAISAGSTALPDSALLDAVLGTDSFTTVVSPEPFDLAQLATQLTVNNRVDCPGCTIDVARFEKQP